MPNASLESNLKTLSNVVRLPKSSQRITLVGRTGTGKTVAGLWHLSNFDLKHPWILIDTKTDEHINAIEKARHITFDEVPKAKDTGLFVIHPLPGDYKRPNSLTPSPLEIYLWKIWARENIGIFCDEGFMMGDNPAFEACLTQGRSKKIPMIVCTQRPVWVSRFCFSESDFFQIFHLNDSRDRSTIESFVPIDFDDEESLVEFESWYFDVGKNSLFRFKPVPKIEAILRVFDRKLEERRKWV